MQLSQEKKDKLEREIIEIIANCLEKDLIKETDVPPIVTFYGEKIDNAQSEEDLQAFISEFVQKWPVFNALKIPADQNATEKNEQQITQNVVNLAKEGKLEEAVDLAKTVTEQQKQ
jgi:uncharacterized protein YdaT